MYISFYDVKEEPFRLTPDPRFPHLAEPHRHALAKLVQGVLLGKGMVVVTEAVRTGKTTPLHSVPRLDLSSTTPAAFPRDSSRELEQKKHNPRSTTDILIEAMKQGRATTKE